MLTNNNAFARARAMMAAIAVAMSLSSEAQRQVALSGIGPYVSRGKGRGGRPSSGHKVAMDKRAAKKARNVARHKRACR